MALTQAMSFGSKQRDAKAHLWPQGGDVEEVHVAQVGEADQRVLAVVLLGRGAEDHQRHLPHPAALVRCQLELGLGAHLRQREHLGGGGG